jgi:hypothetical protein
MKQAYCCAARAYGCGELLTMTGAANFKIDDNYAAPSIRHTHSLPAPFPTAQLRRADALVQAGICMAGLQPATWVLPQVALAASSSPPQHQIAKRLSVCHHLSILDWL